MLIQQSQGGKHRGLPPMQSWRFICDQGIFSVIKIAAWVLHMRDRPTGYFGSQLHAFCMESSQMHKRLNALRGALDIDWEGFTVIVTRSAVRNEEGADKVFITPLQGDQVLFIL